MTKAILLQQPRVKFECDCGAGVDITGEMRLPCYCGREYSVALRLTEYAPPTPIEGTEPNMVFEGARYKVPIDNRD